MTNIKYGSEMDNYCKIHNLYIDERLESRNTSGRNGNIVIKITVKYKDRVIIDIESKSLLKEEELCVGAISELINVSQSAVSHQLRVLKNSKIVKPKRVGKQIRNNST